MNLTSAQADVRSFCDAKGISISDIETLPSGGTHVVCTLSEGAEDVRRKFAKQIIPGKVRRFAYFHLAHSR